MRYLGAVCFVSNRRVAPIFNQQPLIYLDLTVCWEFARWEGSGNEERKMSRSFYTPSRIVSHICFLRDIILVWLIKERSMNTYIFRWHRILSGETKQGANGRFTNPLHAPKILKNFEAFWLLNQWWCYWELRFLVESLCRRPSEAARLREIFFHENLMTVLGPTWKRLIKTTADGTP